MIELFLIYVATVFLSTGLMVWTNWYEGHALLMRDLRKLLAPALIPLFNVIFAVAVVFAVLVYKDGTTILLKGRNHE
jgi:hypothetical protein